MANVTVTLYRDANGNGVVDTGEPLLAHDDDRRRRQLQLHQPAGRRLRRGRRRKRQRHPQPRSPHHAIHRRDPGRGPKQDGRGLPVRPVLLSKDRGQDHSAAAGEQAHLHALSRYFGENLLAGVVVNDPIPAGTHLPRSQHQPGAPAGEAVDDDGTGGHGHRPRGLGPGQQRGRLTGLQRRHGHVSGNARPSSQTKTPTSTPDDLNVPTTAGRPRILEATPTDRLFHGLCDFTLPDVSPSARCSTRPSSLSPLKSGQNADRTVSIRKLLTGTWTGGTFREYLHAPARPGKGQTAPTTLASPAATSAAATYGQQLGTHLAGHGGATYAAVVTSAVKSGILTPATNYGLALLGDGTDTGTVKFHSRTGDAGNEPKLVLTYRVPTAGGCSGTFTLTDIADTYIQEDSGGNEKFGDATNEGGPENTKHKHALLKFDITGIPVGATVTAATLKVRSGPPSPTSPATSTG